MAWVWDHSETICHLTAHGWVRGYDTERNPPADRVETWRITIDQKRPWSLRDEDWRCVWASPWVARAERDKIRSKYIPMVGWSWATVLYRRLTMHDPL